MDTVTLISCDNAEYKVSETEARMSTIIGDLLGDVEPTEEGEQRIPLPNVSGQVLGKVTEYLKYHAAAAAAAAAAPAVAEPPVAVTVPSAAAAAATAAAFRAQEVHKRFDDAYVQVSKDVLFELVLAANYLNIKGLLDLTCGAVANLIKGKTPEEIRAEFNIESDMTEEEEAAARRENAWAFE